MKKKIIFFLLLLITIGCSGDSHSFKSDDIFSFFFPKKWWNSLKIHFSKYEIVILRRFFENLKFKKFTSNSVEMFSDENRLFKHAVDEFIKSLDFNLDQKKTLVAIDLLKTFIQRYPNHEKIKEAKNILDILMKKLEKKDFYIANSYFLMQKYKSSLIYFQDFIKRYPDSIFKEKVLYKICVIKYKMADNKEKASTFFDSYNEYVKLYPNSNSRIKELQMYYKKLIRL
ncbi:outer membrane protein assembly factor BamD [Blattabacterium cuenoti]|uniref:outer membrane protein assembly factor BamD n=1 Tax=Blattabacterium cuenoti TaxID=1653831 RepID=UPI00163B7FE4|nr:outer membrane protein assembly factor BamD [Blattabacterium cuenoti]